MKYFSTFSGIGGFELGIQQAYDYLSNTSRKKQRGIKKIGTDSKLKELVTQQPTCVGFSEIDKYATQIYQRHFPKHKNYGDITKINPKELPDFDILVGGFPCQSFSIAGKRGGFSDTRGTLFFEIARIIREKQPRLLLLENVKGLLSHDKGNTFTTIISTLDELGYDCQWQVLNSKNFGVPQNRERVFIVGHLRGTSRPEVFPFGEESKKDTRRVGEEVSYCLDANYHKGTNTTKNGRRQVIPVLTPDRLNKRQNGRRFKENGDPSFTLTAQDRHGILQLNKPKHSNNRVYSDKGLSQTLNTAQGGNRQPFIKGNTKIRRLTPTECERLQGFPDGWTEKGWKGPFVGTHPFEEVEISDTQRYKTLGNAVTVNVVKEIVKKICT